MSTSNKLTYLNETKQELKQAINNLGGSITDETTFRQYVNQLDGVYDVLPKTSFQEGTEVTIENGLKGKIDFDTDNGKKIVGYGDTEQDGEPTSSTPVAIQCVTGNQEIVESGKNLFSSEMEVGGFDTNGLNSNISTRLRSKDYIQIENSTNYTINAVNNTNSNLAISISYYTTNDYVTNRTGYINWTTLPHTFSIPSECKYIRILFRITDDRDINISDVSNIMLVKGNTSTTYEPYHTPITYPISLGDIELCGIGDYKDELVTDRSNGKWYKYEKIGKYTFTGQENIVYDVNNRFQINNIVENLEETGRQRIWCNRYKFLASGSADYGMFAFYNNGYHQVYIYDKDYTNSDNYKAYLSNNLTYFYYIKNTPTLTEITDTTLIEQLENWYNSKSFNGTTIIESNGDLPMIIKVRALKGES